jgi:hypothetical protein
MPRSAAIGPAGSAVSDRKAFGDFVVAERKKWGTLIGELKIKVE